MERVVTRLPIRRRGVMALHSIGKYSCRRVRRIAKLGTAGIHMLLSQTEGGVHRRFGG